MAESKVLKLYFLINPRTSCHLGRKILLEIHSGASRNAHQTSKDDFKILKWNEGKGV